MNLMAQRTTGVSIFEIAKMAKMEQEVDTKAWLEALKTKGVRKTEADYVFLFSACQEELRDTVQDMQILKNELEKIGDCQTTRVCDSFLAWVKEGERSGLWML